MPRASWPAPGFKGLRLTAGRRRVAGARIYEAYAWQPGAGLFGFGYAWRVVFGTLKKSGAGRAAASQNA